MLNDELTDEKQNAPKTCSKCGRTFPTREFPMSTAYGYTIVRARCRECMRTYYASYNRRRVVPRVASR